jgi:hypothetical protein
LFRQEQRSLLREEQSEMRALFTVEHQGHSGFLMYEASYYKRDADVVYYCDIPGVTSTLLADGYKQEPPFYIEEEVWRYKPERTQPSGDDEAHVSRLIRPHQL